MKNSSKVIVVLCLAVITFIILNPVILFSYGLESNFSWTFSALSHWFVLTVLLLPTIFLLRIEKSKVLNIVLKITIVLVVYGLYFAMNPIYQGDYSKTDEELSISDNSLLRQIVNTNPTFDGVVCIASPGCPHCKVATRYRLKLIKQRSNVDVAVFLAAKDSTSLEYYIEETGAGELDYYLVEDTEGMLEISRGTYPTFVYIKEGKIVHRWSNDNMGYPALDWIESGLN